MADRGELDRRQSCCHTLEMRHNEGSIDTNSDLDCHVFYFVPIDKSK